MRDRRRDRPPVPRRAPRSTAATTAASVTTSPSNEPFVKRNAVSKASNERT